MDIFLTFVYVVESKVMGMEESSKFPYWKVGVWYKESRSFLIPKSEGRKSTEKDSSWPPERLVNFVYFCGKEGTAAELCEVRQGGIVDKERAEFLPGRVGLDVGEVHLGQLRSAQGS